VLLGQEHLPALATSERPLLFVGNHQKMGLYDMPLLAYELYMRGFKVKGLAHPGHWAGPLGPFFEQFGAVKAGPMTAYKLLKAKQQVSSRMVMQNSIPMHFASTCQVQLAVVDAPAGCCTSTAKGMRVDIPILALTCVVHGQCSMCACLDSQPGFALSSPPNSPQQQPPQPSPAQGVFVHTSPWRDDESMAAQTAIHSPNYPKPEVCCRSQSQLAPPA
jgi:hypothetical protein